MICSMFINKKNLFFIAISIIMFFGCVNIKPSKSIYPKDDISLRFKSGAFDTLVHNKPVKLYFLRNKKNMQAAITNYGGRIVSLLVPDKNGNLTDVVLGHDKIKSYLSVSESYFGALIGRYGNRLSNGSFTIDGETFQSSLNNGVNMLHGGKKGFHTQVWQAKMIGDDALELTYFSKAMEEGFPGNLHVKVTYKLTEDNGLKISYEANTDASTVVNLTNHSYFNLNGEGSGTILNHSLQVFANQYTPVNDKLIPTGKIESVRNTPFDFNRPKTIGKDIENEDRQLKSGKGYDHNFVLNKNTKEDMILAAIVKGDQSGIVMEVYTEEPGIQFYSGNFMSGKKTLKNNSKDFYRTAFCLETQHFPDSPNQPLFPSTLLKKDDNYSSNTIYEFNIGK